MKINEKKFAIAEQQAHNEFWLSDAIQVTEAVRSAILLRNPPVAASRETAYYTALICHEAVKYELRCGKELRAEKRAARKANKE